MIIPDKIGSSPLRTAENTDSKTDRCYFFRILTGRRKNRMACGVSKHPFGRRLSAEL